MSSFGVRLVRCEPDRCLDLDLLVFDDLCRVEVLDGEELFDLVDTYFFVCFVGVVMSSMAIQTRQA